MYQVSLLLCKNSEVTVRAFLTLLLLQIKYATQDNPNNIGLTFSPKNQVLQVGRKQILVSVSRHIKLTENCKKACVAVFVIVYSYNDFTHCEKYRNFS